MNLFKHTMTDKVFQDINAIEDERLIKKIKICFGLLDEKGYNLPSQYMDKVEGYKNLFELRPHIHNIEFRMVFFWQGSNAHIIHTFYERGKKKKNQNEYATATANALRNTLI